MLTKLLKYDYKNITKNIFPMYIVAFAMFIVSTLFAFLETKFKILTIPNSLVTIIFILAIIAVPMYQLVIIIKNYYQSMIKDEGYLTHTLPVSKNSIVLSKFISSYTSMLFTILIVIIFVVLRFHDTKGIVDIFNTAKEFLSTTYGMSMILLFIIMTLVSLASLLLSIFFSISLGQKHNNKLLMSAVYALILYYVNQMINLIILVLPILFVKDYIDQMNADYPSKEILYYIFISTAVVSIIVSFVYNRLTVKNLENKLNLE